MKILTAILLTGAALIGGAATAAAADKTEISVSRFFGACEADYGNVTDVSKANGECGIITDAGRKNFQGDDAVQLFLPRPINGAHAAFADESEDFQLREKLRDFPD